MLFQTLGRLKRQSVLAAILMMALGIFILICPETFINSLIIAVGYVMIIFSIVKILEFIAGKKGYGGGIVRHSRMRSPSAELN